MKKFRYLSNFNINKVKWDDCISNSFNRRVYALSWYLDIVAVKWDAIVYGDYEAVCPIVFKKRLFFKKHYHPLFAQQLGLFILDNRYSDRKELIMLFFSFINKKLKGYEFCFTAELSDDLEQFSEKNSFKIRKNLELSCSSNYEQIHKKYKKNIIRNLQKSSLKELYMTNKFMIEDFITLYTVNVAKKINLSSKNLIKISNIINVCLERKMGCLLGVKSKSHLLNSSDKSAGSSVIEAAFIISCFNRDIVIFHATEKQYKSYQPMTFLLNYYIENHLNSNKVLDFEGSNIPGIYRFYKGFGAVENNYLHIKK